MKRIREFQAFRSASHIALTAAMLLSAGCDLGGPRGPGASQRIANVLEPDSQQLEKIDQANAARQAGDYDAALSLFQEILAQNPTLTTAYLGIGDIYLVKQDYAKAEPAFHRAARLEPRNFDAQYGHGVALQMLNRLVEAVRAYHRALTIDPQSVKANLNIAVTYLQMNEAANAVTFAERAVQLEPGNGAARINLGAAYEKTGQNGKAIEQYLAAMELVEDTTPIMVNLVSVLAAEKRYQEAINTAENLLKIEQSANIYERMGWCYFRLSNFEKSLDAYQQAVNVDPKHWQSHNGIGVNMLNRWLLSKKQDAQARLEARDAFRRSLLINPDQPKLVLLMTSYELDR
jgi:tetratricopeptide (TPR) repeat protein